MEEKLSSREMIIRLAEFVNMHDAEGLMSLYTEDVEYIDIASPEDSLIGNEAYKKTSEAYFTAFPDLYNDVRRIICGDDGVYVAVEYCLQGTHTGDAGDIPPSGKFFRVGIVSIFERRGNQFCKETQYWDKKTFYGQLGWNL